MAAVLCTHRQAAFRARRSRPPARTSCELGVERHGPWPRISPRARCRRSRAAHPPSPTGAAAPGCRPSGGPAAAGRHTDTRRGRVERVGAGKQGQGCTPVGVRWAPKAGPASCGQSSWRCIAGGCAPSGQQAARELPSAPTPPRGQPSRAAHLQPGHQPAPARIPGQPIHARPLPSRILQQLLLGAYSSGRAGGIKRLGNGSRHVGCMPTACGSSCTPPTARQTPPPLTS